MARVFTNVFVTIYVDLFVRGSTEEIGHLEMVGKLIEMHTVGEAKVKAEESPLFAMRGKGPHSLDSMGSAWTASYINEGGDVVRDLRAKHMKN